MKIVLLKIIILFGLIIFLPFQKGLCSTLYVQNTNIINSQNNQLMTVKSSGIGFNIYKTSLEMTYYPMWMFIVSVNDAKVERIEVYQLVNNNPFLIAFDYNFESANAFYVLGIPLKSNELGWVNDNTNNQISFVFKMYNRNNEIGETTQTFIFDNEFKKRYTSTINSIKKQTGF